MNLPFYNKIIFKVFVTITIVLGLSFSISYFLAMQYANNMINKNISKEFSNALNVTENYIKIIGQTSKIWAQHSIIDSNLKNKLIKKEYTGVTKLLKIEKEAISADSIILLDSKGMIISTIGSDYTVGDSLLSQDIVKNTFLFKKPITKIAREKENFIIYSSSLILKDKNILGILLIGYFINDIFLENIKVSKDIAVAFVGNSAIMSSTEWGKGKTLDILPIDFLRYQSLLKNPNQFKVIYHNGEKFIISARKLKNIDSSISGSILIGYSTKDISIQKNDIFYKLVILFGSIFLITLVILLSLSNRIISSINMLKKSTQIIATGKLNSRVIVNSNDELNILAHNFNKMVDSIELKNKQLKKYTEDLEKEVQSRTEELIEKEKQLIQASKMAAMGEMLENIAHQWRQPLSVISTASTGLYMQMKLNIPPTKEEEMDILLNINNSAQFLSQTINDFRDFFKPDKKKELYNIKDIYLKTFNIIRSKFKNSEIEIIESLDDIEINGFKGELSQVIINLLNNAKDVLESKKNQKLLIFVTIYKSGNNAIISIKDNGGGIPENIIYKIFEPYFTTKYKSQGTGIGLYMCEQMLTKHMDGSLEVDNIKYTYDNIEYIGAEFKIILPI